MRKRFVTIGKRVIFALAVVFAGVLFAYEGPEWLEKVSHIEPVVVPPAHGNPAEPVPEPATMVLIGLGGGALAYRRARQKKID